jgi:hypothetical protein
MTSQQELQRQGLQLPFWLKSPSPELQPDIPLELVLGLERWLASGAAEGGSIRV